MLASLSSLALLVMHRIFHSVADTIGQTISFLISFLTATYFEQNGGLELRDTSRNMKHIVILGGSYAGVSTAHRIFKQASKTGPVKITIVTPNTDVYWNMAAPRGIIPNEFDDEKLFQPIAAGFKQYPASQFEFILAKAKSFDVDSKTVDVCSSDGNSRSLNYDFLILATGSSTHGNIPLKGLESTEATRDALHEYQLQVKKSKNIVVAGSGVTGVEVAGELGFAYGKDKEIILVSISLKAWQSNVNR